jgi:hypothetical protein
MFRWFGLFAASHFFCTGAIEDNSGHGDRVGETTQGRSLFFYRSAFACDESGASSMRPTVSFITNMLANSPNKSLLLTFTRPVCGCFGFLSRQ